MTASAHLLTARRWWIRVALALTLLLAVGGMALCVGSTGDIGWPTDSIKFGLRFEKVLLATMVGAALAGAGCAFQSVLRNDLADPYLLGIASGAGLMSYLWTLPAVAASLAAISPTVSAFSQQTFAFIGAVSAALLVLMVAGARGRIEPSTLVLTGVILSTICGALVMLIFTFVKSRPGSGSFQSVFIGDLQTSLSIAQLRIAGALIALGLLVIGLRLPMLNLVALGEDEARTLGVNVTRERVVLLLVASLVTAAAVSVSGPIGFVGLIAPHVARRIVGVDQRIAMPIACVAGAVLLVASDAILRYLAGVRIVNTIIPIGVATALLGGPFFLVLLFHKRKGTA